MSSLTFEQVHELLVYNPDTGILTWRHGRTGTAKPGVVAGSPHRDGYIQIKINRKNHFAHRLAWLLHMGSWPIGHIDHLDGNRSNNRISNLRDVSRTTNQENRQRAQVNNKSGFLGVCPSGKRWISKIRVNGEQQYLGCFDTPELAHAAYLEAKRRLHPGCTI